MKGEGDWEFVAVYALLVALCVVAIVWGGEMMTVEVRIGNTTTTTTSLP